MASSDEDELAELRAARAVAGGAPALSLAALRAQQQQAVAAEEARSIPQITGRDSPEPQRVSMQTDEAQEEELDLSKFNLPSSFGEKPKPSLQPKVDAFHAQTRRSPGPPSFGPRPPARIQIAPAVGPPRPSAAGQQGPGETSGQASQFGPPRPPRQTGGANEQQDASAEDAQVGPARPPDDSGSGGSGVGAEGLSEDPDDQGGEGSEDEGEGQEDPYSLPITHEVTLGSAHTKGVTCMDVDHTGSRLLTGSMDYTVRIYDFNGMKRDMKAFREFEPQDGHPVVSLSWSPTGDAFLVVTGSAQAKIYDRDGRALGEFVRGDMYIRDMKNTKGHVSGLTAGQWHPTDRFTAMTSSDDGTVRIWDTHNILQKTVVKPTLLRPGRVGVSTCSYGSDGRLIAAGLMDGSIQIWSVGGKFGSSAAVGQVLPPTPQMVEKQNWSYVSRSNQVARDAHVSGSEITCLTFSQDGNSLLSRGLDSTLKLWDLRKFKSPVKTWDALPCAYATTRAIFSPDEQLILTCVAADQGRPSGLAAGAAAAGGAAGGSGGAGAKPPGEDSEGGAVVFIDKSSLEVVRRVGMPAPANTLTWHHRLNQIIVGCGNRKAGATRVLYDPSLSQRGVLYGASRAPRKPSPFDLTLEQMARMEYDKPLFKRERMTGKKRREQAAHDAVKYRKPDPGMAAGMGKQGRIGTTTKTLLTQHIMKMKGELKRPDTELDPREALLRHADKDDVFSRLTDAYRTTQPVPIFAQEDEEEDEGEDQDT